MHAEQIDPSIDPRWDAFVATHPAGWVTHHSAWKRVLEQTFGHMKGYCLALIDHDRRIRAGIPLFDVRSPIIGRRLVSVPFATIADPLVEAQEDLNELLEEATELRNRLHAGYLEIRTLHTTWMLDQRMRASLFRYHYLHLQKDPDQLRKTFHRSCVQQRISRAAKSSITARRATGIEEIKAIYPLYVSMRQRIGLPPQPYRFFTALWRNLHPGMADLLVAEKDGKIVAGLLLLKFGNRVSAEVNVADARYRDMSPSHLLIWEAMKMARTEGYEIFDFGRTAPDNLSLIRYKEHWGTSVSDISTFVFTECSDGIFPRPSATMPPVLKALSPMVPRFAFTFLGRLCYRHLA